MNTARPMRVAVPITDAEFIIARENEMAEFIETVEDVNKTFVLARMLFKRGHIDKEYYDMWTHSLTRELKMLAIARHNTARLMNRGM